MIPDRYLIDRYEHCNHCEAACKASFRKHYQSSNIALDLFYSEMYFTKWDKKSQMSLKLSLGAVIIFFVRFNSYFHKTRANDNNISFAQFFCKKHKFTVNQKNNNYLPRLQLELQILYIWIFECLNVSHTTSAE